MNVDSLPSAGALRAQLVGILCLSGGVPGILAVVFLAPVLRLNSGELEFLVYLVLIVAFPLILLSAVLAQRWVTGTLRYLSECQAGSDPSKEVVDRAFDHAVDLPRLFFLWSMVCFTGGSIFIAGVMGWKFASVSLFDALILVTAATTSGIVGEAAGAVLLKNALSPYRVHLASRIPDPEERSQIARYVPLSRQFLVCTFGLTLTAAFYGMLFISGINLDEKATLLLEHQSALADEIFESAETAGVALDEVVAVQAPAMRAMGVYPVLLDSSTTEVVTGELTLLTEQELNDLRESGESAGDNRSMHSRNRFTWRMIEGDDRVLVLVSPAGDATAQIDDVAGPILLTLLSAGIVTLLICNFVAGDLKRSTALTRIQIARIASGDLRTGDVFESENEFGELARAVDGMRLSLSETVTSLVEATGEVEQVAVAITGTTESILESSLRQVGDVDQVTEAIDHVTIQVTEITDSAGRLGDTAEGSSDSVQELQAVGGGLADMAIVLSKRAKDTSFSIEQMMQSIQQVGDNTDELVSSVEETSASLAEMSVQMEQVKSNAGETASLSENVTLAADRGQERVQETIEGMAHIRDATNAANDVVRSLVDRTSDIGGIVSVIDGVADETNLLALNAAIIAAQAGVHGRGFAVVADEIKALADRVTMNTKEISTLIEQLQQESGKAAGVIGAGSKSVERGVELSAEAGLSLEEITAAARESGQRTLEIVAAVQENTSTSQHVVMLMERVQESVESIRHAGQGQQHVSDAVLEGASKVDQMSLQVRQSAEGQSEGTKYIAENILDVQSAATSIRAALEEQRAACQQVMTLLGSFQDQAQTSATSARESSVAVRDLLERFQQLRKDVLQRFRVG